MNFILYRVVGLGAIFWCFYFPRITLGQCATGGGIAACMFALFCMRCHLLAKYNSPA